MTSAATRRPRTPYSRKLAASAVSYLEEFCQNTSLHGFRYLGEKERPLPEKICWLIAMAVSTVFCAHFILMLWLQWNATPVIVTLSEAPTPIWDIPFPAVTICSASRVRQTVFNYTAVLSKENHTAEEIENLGHLSIICHGYLNSATTIDEKSLEFLRKVAPPLQEVVNGCFWKARYRLSEEMFVPVITDAGLCYTFNTLGAEEIFSNASYQKAEQFLNYENSSANWDLENGYSNELDEEIFPLRSVLPGSTEGLQIIFQTKSKDSDVKCSEAASGFKVLLHNPAVFPQVKSKYFQVPTNHKVMVAVRPNIMKTRDSLRGYDPERRQCYFHDERRLHFFNIYTQENCQLECITNHTLLKCACAEYYMPRNKDTPLCGTNGSSCTYKLSYYLAKNLSLRLECHCMPACTEIKYDVEISQSPLDTEKVRSIISSSGGNLTGKDLGHVAIYFKDTHFISTQRSELYGNASFLGDCGGVLGLYLGFSLLSLVEITYFLTVRLWTNLLRLARRLRKPGSTV